MNVARRMVMMELPLQDFIWQDLDNGRARVLLPEEVLLRAVAELRADAGQQAEAFGALLRLASVLRPTSVLKPKECNRRRDHIPHVWPLQAPKWSCPGKGKVPAKSEDDARWLYSQSGFVQCVSPVGHPAHPWNFEDGPDICNGRLSKWQSTNCVSYEECVAPFQSCDIAVQHGQHVYVARTKEIPIPAPGENPGQLVLRKCEGGNSKKEAS